MIAMLGMYDHPAIQGANDRYWALIRDHLGRGPETLTRDRDFWDMWLSPDLLLGQTCGLPYRSRLHDKVTKICTPDYGLPDCPAGHYKSCFVVRKDSDVRTLKDLDGLRMVYNEDVSQSGWAGPMAHLRANGVTPASAEATGAHVNSMKAVAEGRADFSGIDGITWNTLLAHEPAADTLRIIDWTPPTPGLPYITSLSNDPEPLEKAIQAAIDGLAPADRETLQLRGIVNIPTEEYLSVETPPHPAAAA
ncbi:phosphate/phosphite/phosphonate ABC transporter substrate-binding protein [Chachezhania antarctica]|uniref:phosphate/phosphite/phosphonate ABC transporter substrate-binding protein n=1 Tax=Chachezhania antarctica TaxID=2340860 RepID=UPI000EB3C18E|nr:PhnD/SsuA/transferrin family substrate-binding protein [Chachezhania antarctica]